MSEFKKLKIQHIFPDDLDSKFVSNIIVQHQPDHFVVSFFEVFPPPILGDSEEDKRRQFRGIDHVNAKCVSRIVVTPDKMGEIITVLSDNYNNYLNTKKK
jgi:hypothetical protein